MELADQTSDGLLRRHETMEKKSTDRSRRQTWSSQLDFIMAGIGAAVGLGNIWRFPFLCYKNGGGAFLIPYLISFFLMSAPIYILEIGLGQYTGGACVGAWNILPAFKGVGVCGAVILWYINIYYVIVITWSLYFLFMSLRSEVPWASCGHSWNTARCFVSGMSLDKTSSNCTTFATLNMSEANCSFGNDTQLPAIDAVEEFWENHVLRRSSSIEEPGGLVPGLAMSLIVAWFLVFFCLFKGLRWTGKLVYVTATMPYLLLMVMLIRTAMLTGAKEGIIYYLKPDFSRLIDGQVWIDAATQVLFSTGVGQGYLLTLGSYNKFHANPIRNGFIITSINCFTSLFGGFCVFSVLGFMAAETGQSIKDVVSSGPGLTFLTYPKALTQLPLTSLWSALFFAMLVFLGLDSEFAVAEGFITIFLDIFPKTLHIPRNRILLLATHCVFSFLVGLTMVTEGGIYVFGIIDHYAVCGVVLLIEVFFEAVVVGWAFGADKFSDALELMVGYRAGPWMKISWKFLTPVATMVIIVFQMITFKPLQYDANYRFPLWTNVVGIALILSSVIWIPAAIVYRLIKSRGGLRERWQGIFIPHLRKQQVHPKWLQRVFDWHEIENDTKLAF